MLEQRANVPGSPRVELDPIWDTADCLGGDQRRAIPGEWVEDRVAWAGVLPQECRAQRFGVAQVIVLEFGGKLAALLFLQA